jgi:hypothetical protein
MFPESWTDPMRDTERSNRVDQSTTTSDSAVFSDGCLYERMGLIVRLLGFMVELITTVKCNARTYRRCRRCANARKSAGNRERTWFSCQRIGSI